MMMMMLFSALLSSVFALGALAVPAAPATTTCNRDNILRCFVATPVPASSYCSLYVGTSTVYTATTTPTRTLDFTATTTGTTTTTSPVTTTTTTTGTSLTTETDIVPTTSTTIVTVYQTVTTTTFSTTTVATVTITPGKKKRQIEPTAAIGLDALSHVLATALARRDVTGPTCLTKDGTTFTSYSPPRITSACSCIGITQKIVSTISTAPAVTVSSTSTVPATVVATSTLTMTSIITQTATQTVSTTISITALVTSTTTGTTLTTTTAVVSATATTTGPPTPPCGTSSVTGTAAPFPPVKYQQFFAGVGLDLTDKNPANTDASKPPLEQSYPATTDGCVALQQCASFATGSPGEYFTLSFYRSKSTGIYRCRIYYNQLSDGSYFNIPNPDEQLSFGYVAISNS